MDIFVERLKKALELNDWRPTDLSNKSGVSRALISQYSHGIIKPSAEPLLKMAKALNVSEAWLMGQSDIMERPNATDFNRLHQVDKKLFPLLGSVACGEPVFADENFETYVQADKDIDADFCIRASGDSMIEADIHDGDIVFIKKKPIVQNGRIAVVSIGGETTLKRVYSDKENNRLTLVPANPNYLPIVVQNEELEQARILGEAIFFQRNIK